MWLNALIMACVQIITYFFLHFWTCTLYSDWCEAEIREIRYNRLKLVKNCHLAVHMLHTSIIIFAVKWPKAKHCNSMCQWLCELPRRLIEDDKEKCTLPDQKWSDKTILKQVSIHVISKFYNLNMACAGPGFFSRVEVQARRPENSLDNVYLVLNLFYSLQRGSNDIITEKTILFQGTRGGPTLFRGSGWGRVQLFPGGPNANFYRNP